MRYTPLDTQAHTATIDVLKACEALNAFTHEAQHNVNRVDPAVLDEEERVLFTRALELMNCSLFEASLIMLEPHYPTDHAPKKTPLGLV
jgi:hypothetical protein